MLDARLFRRRQHGLPERRTDTSHVGGGKRAARHRGLAQESSTSNVWKEERGVSHGESADPIRMPAVRRLRHSDCSGPCMALVERIGRYTEFARFLGKYGTSDVINASARAAQPADAEEFAADVEQLGPTFIKLGQLLSTRADLLQPAYAEALARLQDHVEPFPFADVARIVEEDLDIRLS